MIRKLLSKLKPKAKAPAPWVYLSHRFVGTLEGVHIYQVKHGRGDGGESRIVVRRFDGHHPPQSDEKMAEHFRRTAHLD